MGKAYDPALSRENTEDTPIEIDGVQVVTGEQILKGMRRAIAHR